VLRHDGKTDRFPVVNGDVAQARLRAALAQRPEDSVVEVTKDTFIRVRWDRADSYPAVATSPKS
jgi:hypothetical protein